jgi:peptidoglycan/LPS O-acetylase OafA/YrhL
MWAAGNPAGGYRLGRRPAFDGVRALAVGGVLLYHSTSHVPAGFYGVDVFFVLSGFLITSLLLAEHKKRGRNDLRGFYIRRGRRLLPALFASLAIVALTFAIWNQESARDLFEDFVAILLYVANWVLALNPKGNLADGLLNPTWSLAIEEQFYILWPITLIALLRRRRSRPTLVAIVASSAAASAILRASLAYNPSFAYFATPTHADGILAGCALALAVDARFTSKRLRATTSVLGCAVAASVVVVAAVLDPHPRWLSSRSSSPPRPCSSRTSPSSIGRPSHASWRCGL